MERAEHRKLVVSAAKSLKRFQLADARIAALLYATSQAGRAFIVLNERHLRRLLRAYLAYYNTARPHQALGNNSPRPREFQPPAHGRIVALPSGGWPTSPLSARRLITGVSARSSQGCRRAAAGCGPSLQGRRR